MGKRVTFTKPERARLANKAAAMIREVTGQAVEFAPSDIDPHESIIALDKFETVNGPFRWANFRVEPEGVAVHIAFEDIERAAPVCAGINPYSGKWNHYLYPSKHVSKPERELCFILTRLQPAD